MKDNAELNEAVYRLYCFGRERNIPVSGPFRKEEALLTATELDPNATFRTPNGWLDSFKKCHKLKV